MKLWKAFYVLITILCEVNCDISKVRRKSLICNAVKSLIALSTSLKSPVMDIVTNSKEAETFDCLKSILLSLNVASTHTKFPIKTHQKIFGQRKKNDILMIFNSSESLKLFIINMTADEFNFHGFYLIILTFNHTSKLDEMFDLLWGSFIYNVNILMQVNNSVKLFTFFPFNDRKCHDTKSVEINEYSKGKWQKSLFFPQKLFNFFKCQLKAGCYNYGPSALPSIDRSGNEKLNGSDVEIMQALANSLNIDLKIEIYSEVGQVWENGTSVGLFKDVIEGKVDICACFFYLNQLRGKFMQFTRAYYSIDILMMIPRGVPFSAFEKIVQPLEPTVWFSFIGFLAIVFVAVAVIRCQSRKVQFLFFDRNINAPVMEILVVLFGSSQHMMPRKSFSRMLLMTFSIFCFVVRTIYTGSLFQFLQVGLKKKV